MSEDGFEEWISSSNATDSKCTSTIAAATTSLSLAPTLQSSEDDKELKIKRLKKWEMVFSAIRFWGSSNLCRSKQPVPSLSSHFSRLYCEGWSCKGFQNPVGHPPVADVRSLTHYREP
ncbi:hypothetical protein CsatB_025501 [Cannabis sativa]